MLSLSGPSAQEKLSNLVREARQKKNLALKEVAYSVGYKSTSFISSMERGKRSVPLSAARSLSQCLGIPLEQLNQAIYEAVIEKRGGCEYSIRSSG